MPTPAPAAAFDGIKAGLTSRIEMLGSTQHASALLAYISGSSLPCDMDCDASRFGITDYHVCVIIGIKHSNNIAVIKQKVG